MLASPLPPSFLDTDSLSTSSLECNALCMVINFLVLWSICLSSSLVHFKKRPNYLMRDTAQVFIPLIRFLLDSFVSSSILILLRYSILIFSFISTCLMVSASHLVCVDLCQVTLLCLWILCGILSVSQGTIHGFVVSNKSLPLFVLLIFSTSLVGILWVCSCLGQFLRLGPFGSMWSFLWSSIWVRRHLFISSASLS